MRLPSPLPPSATITSPVQVPINSLLKLEVTGFSGRSVIASLDQQPCSPAQTCQPDYLSAGLEAGGCPAGDRPLNITSGLLQHVCQYTLVPKAATNPICGSITLLQNHPHPPSVILLCDHILHFNCNSCNMDHDT